MVSWASSWILAFCLLIGGNACKQQTYFHGTPDSVNYCDLFHVNMPKHDTVSGGIELPYPDLNKSSESPGFRFVKMHFLRFQYVLMNMDSVKFALARMNTDKPDSITINRRYCGYLKRNVKFNNYFRQLANREWNTQPLEKFAREEMMKIASRFFMWDDVRRSDTSISGHICIGINGISQLKKDRDYLVLEAFCFDAIAFNIQKLAKIFNWYGHLYSRQAKKNFQSFESFVDTVKTKTFESMEKDSKVREILLDFYNKNKQSFGFDIQ